MRLRNGSTQMAERHSGVSHVCEHSRGFTFRGVNGPCNTERPVVQLDRDWFARDKARCPKTLCHCCASGVGVCTDRSIAIGEPKLLPSSVPAKQNSRLFEPKFQVALEIFDPVRAAVPCLPFVAATCKGPHLPTTCVSAAARARSRAFPSESVSARTHSVVSSLRSCKGALTRSLLREGVSEFGQCGVGL